MVPEKDNPTAQAAMAALVRAACQRDQVAIVRFVSHNGGAISTCVAKPVDIEGSKTHGGAPAHVPPPHFILNALPFTEDVRDFRFPSFGKGDKRPDQRALDAAVDLVQALDLEDENDSSPQTGGRLAPERTANPHIRAFLRLVRDKALGADTQTKEMRPRDPLVCRFGKLLFEEKPERFWIGVVKAMSFCGGYVGR